MMARASLLIIFLGTLRTTALLHQQPPHNANQMRKKPQPDVEGVFAVELGEGKKKRSN
jgi:hypothetical protein